ncbi:MAG: ATP synthase F1 subunit delta [Candidatus Solibacter usitatus]|nr:ATP synthase F1 subunit delta [Candidatus Solibacter usitatus]
MSLAVASRYANALVDAVLGSQGQAEPAAVIQQLLAIENAIEQTADFRNILLSPAVTASQKHKLMERLCGMLEVHRLVRNFIFVVVRNRRANLIPQIRSAFERLLDERVGIQRAEVTSAGVLDDAARAALEAQLTRIGGRKVRCQYSVNPELLGGVVARMGSTLYDGSVRGQLETLRRKLVAG